MWLERKILVSEIILVGLRRRKEQQKEKWEKRRSMESRKRGQMIGEKRDRVKQSNKVFEALRGLVIDTQIQLLICLFFRIKSSSSFKQMVLIKCNLLFQI